MASPMRSPPEPEALFDITQFFDGHTRAWGVFEDRFRRVRRRFNVDIDGRWDGRDFVLTERFRYDVGAAEQRTWRIVPGDSGRFTATSSACVGEAVGMSDINSVHMHYRFKLELERRTVVVDVDDRIYHMGGGIAVNRATMSKWGVKIGEVSLFFQRKDYARSGVSEGAAG
jgi:Protein of unknown function (DUF3833)